jgi:preprotein translocase subunit YajC
MTSYLLVLAQAQPTASPWRSLLPMVIMLGAFYVILILPRQREMKRHQAMLGTLQKGDTIVTAGGVIGEIMTIKDDQLTIRSGGSSLVVERQRVSRKVTPKEGK